MRDDVPHPRVYPSRCTLACIFSVNRWDLVGAVPTERKSRIRNNEPREPRGLTRAVKPLWLYSAAPLLFSFVLARFLLFPLLCASIPFHRRSALPSFLFSSRLFSFPFLIPRYTYYYTRCRAIVLIPRNVLTARRILHLHYRSTTIARQLRIFGIHDDFSRWKNRLKYYPNSTALLKCYYSNHVIFNLLFTYLKEWKKIFADNYRITLLLLSEKRIGKIVESISLTKTGNLRGF